MKALTIYQPWASLPRGSVIATAELIGCHEIYESNTLVAERLICINGHPVSRTEQLFGDWTPGRYAWEFTNMRMLYKPIPARGKQRLWEWGYLALVDEYARMEAQP